MFRTLRILATITLVYAVANLFYVLPQFSTNVQRIGILQDVLSTTGITLGLTLAVVALVASAQRRQWRWFGPLLVLAIINQYGGLLYYFVFSAVPALRDVYSQVGLTALLLSYLLPPVVTACTVLAYTLSQRGIDGPRGRLPELEYSSLEAKEVGQSS